MRSPDTSRPEFVAPPPSAHDTLDAQGLVNTDLVQGVFAARDLEWETELLTRLSEQEQRFREFTRRKFQADPHGVLGLAVRMVQAIDADAACHAERATLIRANLPATRTAAAPFLRQAEALPKPPPPRTVLGFTVSTPRVEPVVRSSAAALVRELPTVIESYLLLLGNGFATGHAAAKWVETSSVFTRQLTKLTRHITDAG
ncbi:hypothetical protein [Limnoglobus roseus]|uniref:Uncharacterized protein n=1 Tax=Limnoglobus roseus TaxID=2598579 RepID=A0A5C1A909_9BACT|nr:hypothetical protein [Limnoglobus roseus]QEL14693.1 hypothetical protein PX52LOC_01586 [Limnoglobus roseus]